MQPNNPAPAHPLPTAERLAEIRERLSLISPFPWKRDPATGGADCGIVYSAEGETVVQVFANGWCLERQEEYGDSDLDFLEAAPTDVADLLAALDATTAQLQAARQERQERDQRLWQNGFDYATAENDGRGLVLADWVLWLTGRGDGRDSPAPIADVIGYAQALRGIAPDADALTPAHD